MKRFQINECLESLFWVITLGSVIATLGFVIQGCSKKPKPFGAELVRGYLAAAVGSSAQAESLGFFSREIPGKQIYLPRVTVFLEDTKGGKHSDEVQTDLSGRFTVRVPADSQYRLCWKSDLYGSDCLKDPIHAGHEPVFLSTVLIRLVQREGFVASFGKVRFADDSIPRTLEPLADINSFAMVSLVDSKSTQVAEVPVNNFGEYLLPYLPSRESVQLVASIEGAQTAQTIHPEAYTKGRRLVRYQLTIENSRPRLDAIFPVSGATGKRVQVGTPGGTITLKATTHDRDGDSVQVQWSESPGAGDLSAKTGDEIKWTLPKEAGRYSVVAIASDRKGGYDRYTVGLSVGAPGVPFSGVVAGTDGNFIDGAEVEVNGKTEKTDKQGRFVSYVPEAERYVFNIRMTGYGFYSKIYDRSVAGGRWTLTRATVSTFKPNDEIFSQDKRDERNCPGPDSARVNWREAPVLTEIWWQDGKGNNIPPPIQKKDDRGEGSPILPWRDRSKQGGCGPGISVRIPAKGLETSSGGEPAGQVELSLSTVDLDTPQQMPGDDSVDRGGGRIDWMQSFGAGSVELRDTATGERLRLKADVEADVTIPVDRSQLSAGSALPNKMPLLFYDEVKGVWLEEGMLQLDAAKQNYFAKVKHFSTLNADIEFGSPACIAVQSSIAPPYDLELTIPMPGGAAPKVKTVTITDPPPHVLYNLPTLTNVTIVAIAPGPPPRSLGIFVVNTGPAHAGGFGSPPPPTACANTVTLTTQTFPGQPNSGGQFLHGLFSFEATTINEADIPTPGTTSQQLDQATINYYSNVDPAGDRDNFTKFRTKNGFTRPPGFQLCGASVCDDPDAEINVVFANSGDLGFGRDMHCRRTNTGGSPAFDYACYVTNYGDLNRADGLDAQDASTSTTPGATVAMEFSPILSTDPVTDRHVKFYVYNQAGNRVNNADLDGQGARPIPQLCMVCHSGAYPGGGTVGVPPFNTPASVKLGSRFLPFDLRFYTFASSPDKTALQPAIKRLNEDIVRNAPSIPAPDAIADVVTEMYSGSTTQREEFVVPGWTQAQLPGTVAQENYYKRVVGNTCRTCHMAQPFAPLRFANATEFISGDYLSKAETRVCGELVMPHAKRTHDIFWGQYWQTNFGNFSPTIEGQFQVFGDAIKALPAPSGWVGTWPPAWNGGLCRPVVGGGTTPPSFYSSFVHVLWSRNYGAGAPSGCTNCHSGLSGTPADTRTALLNSAGFFGGGPPAVVLPGDAANSRVMNRLIGTSIGDRMPQNCPAGQKRCLIDAGGAYNPATDTNPASTSTEIDRIRFWINNGALP